MLKEIEGYGEGSSEKHTYEPLFVRNAVTETQFGEKCDDRWWEGTF